MNVPAAVVSGLPALLNFFKHSLVDGLEVQTGKFMMRVAARVFSQYFPAQAGMGRRELTVRVKRLEALFEGFSAENEQYRAESGRAEVANEELYEPALQDFVTGSFYAAMESPSEEKRNVFGRLIAKRLQCSTESSEDLYLRQAFVIARRCNQRLLNELATISLVNDTPQPSENLTRSEIYEWLDANELPVLERVGKEAFHDDDLRYLDSIGALTYDEPADYLTIGTTHAAGVEQMINRVTREPFLAVPNTKTGRFYQWATYLSNGEFSKQSGIHQIPLDSCTLTGPGRIVAEATLYAFDPPRT
ncbi:MAG TPA: hypothetical protein VGF86_09710 [Candidatus Tumulicola sp.]|jgi:hypothetical protein